MLPEEIGALPGLDRLDGDMRLLISLGVILLGILLRHLAIRLIRGDEAMLSDQRRRLMVAVRNSVSGLTVIALLALWAPEIGEFAFSIAAVAVALVIATKELLLCVSGALWKRTTRAFLIGDWVEIGGHSGQVIDEMLLVTQLQEIEPREYRFTGRVILVPNALLLTQPVINHSFRRRFLQHEFTLYAPADAPALAIRDAIVAALSEQFAEFETKARRYGAVIERRTGLALPDVAPSVRLETTESGNPAFRCALFCPREQASGIEQAAARALFAEMARQKDGAAEAAKG